MIASVKRLCIGLWLAYGLDSNIDPSAAGQVTDGLHRLGVPGVESVRGAELSIIERAFGELRSGVLALGAEVGQ